MESEYYKKIDTPPQEDVSSSPPPPSMQPASGPNSSAGVSAMKGAPSEEEKPPEAPHPLPRPDNPETYEISKTPEATPGRDDGPVPAAPTPPPSTLPTNDPTQSDPAANSRRRLKEALSPSESAQPVSSVNPPASTDETGTLSETVNVNSQPTKMTSAGMSAMQGTFRTDYPMGDNGGAAAQINAENADINKANRELREAHQWAENLKTETGLTPEQYLQMKEKQSANPNETEPQETGALENASVAPPLGNKTSAVTDKNIAAGIAPQVDTPNVSVPVSAPLLEYTPPTVPSGNVDLPPVNPNIPGSTTIPPGNVDLPPASPSIPSSPTTSPGNIDLPPVSPSLPSSPTIPPGNVDLPPVSPNVPNSPTTSPGNVVMPVVSPNIPNSPTIQPGNLETPISDSDKERLAQAASELSQVEWLQPEKWKQLTTNEKAIALNQAGEIFGNLYDHPTPPLIIEPNAEPLNLGHYGDGFVFNSKTNEIIGSDYGIWMNETFDYTEKLFGDDPALALETYLHEFRHSYQHEQANRYEKPQFKNLVDNPESASLWSENFKNYIRPEVNEQKYMEQLVECDARSFSGFFRKLFYGT